MFNTTVDEVEGEAMTRRRKVKRRQKGGNLGGLGALLNAYARKRNNADVEYWGYWEVQPRSVSSWERTRGIREWVPSASQAVTTDVTPLGKYELTSTKTLLGEHFQGRQSPQTSSLAVTCQQGSDQCHQ